MRNLNETSLTDAVLAQLAGAPDARYKAVLQSLIRHLHAFVRETELSEEEWFAGIQFLTKTGQKCDAQRQEYILLSDTLGVSMLVDAIQHRAPSGATESTVLGPFYLPESNGLPPWSDIAGDVPGIPTYVSGRVLDMEGAPIAGAVLDVWQTDGEGAYDVQRGIGSERYGRGKFTTDTDGRYGFRTVKPVRYSIPTDGPVGAMLRASGRHPYRPAHIHAIVAAPGYRAVTTHLFVAGDDYLDSDAVFGVKESLIVDFRSRPAGPSPDGASSSTPFCQAEYDFKLVPASSFARGS